MKFQIANLRKRKVAHDKQLTKLTSKNEKLQEETEKLKDKNDRDFENIETNKEFTFNNNLLYKQFIFYYSVYNLR